MQEILDFLGRIEPLKGIPRHSWTSRGDRESVAAHSWRLAVMALLLRRAFPALDMERVVAMCLVHDFGEAVTGDIPAFEKSAADDADEAAAVADLLGSLPAALLPEYTALFAELEAQKTPESRLFKALDKLEAVLQHNEAGTGNWLPLEHRLQQTYGVAEAAEFPAVQALREAVRQESARLTRAAQEQI